MDISKAFDKVWHDGLLLKLQCNGISGPLLHFLIAILVTDAKGLFLMA